MGWLAATIVFVGFTALIGGPTEGDAAVSVYSTWLIAHGHLACAYAPLGHYRFSSLALPHTLIVPLYPALTAVVAAVTRIGHVAPFPSTAQLGVGCVSAFKATYLWSVKGSAILPTIRISHLTWLPLMFGLTSFLRGAGKGRRRWEPAALVATALTPPVFMSLTSFFHSQDLLAPGLGLGALGFVLSERWAWAGTLLGLALCANQFTLLIAAVLIVVVPAGRRIRFVASVAAAVVTVDLPFVVIAGARALRASIFGSGFNTATGGTVLRELHLHAAIQFTTSRVLPIALALALSMWALRRLGPAVLQPPALASLVATALGLRLVFEENIFGYYFVALSVMLLAIQVLKGRIDGRYVAWPALVTLAFNPIPWGFASNGQPWGLTIHENLAFYFMGVAAVLIVVDALRRRVRWYLVLWFVLVAAVFVNFPWLHEVNRLTAPKWFWQSILVPSGLALAVGPSSP